MAYKKVLMPLLCYVCILSLSASATDKKKSYERSAFINYRTLPFNAKAVNEKKKDISKQFPGWSITSDKLNGLFKDVYGPPIALPGQSNPERAKNCINNNLRSLGVIQPEWQQVSAKEARNASYVYYTQVIDGHPVVFSKLSFRFTKNGDLARIQMKNFGEPTSAPKLPVSADEAKKIAVAELDGVNVTKIEIEAKWYWFPIPHEGGYTLHAAWRFTVTGKVPGQVPLQLTGFIDATDGTILYRNNEVKETTYDLTTKGVVYKNGTYNPATLEPLAGLKLTIGGVDYFTDTSGRFSSGGITLPQSTAIPLEGKWSTVYDDATSTTPLFTDLVTTGGTTYTYPTTLPSSSRHINAYYHVNKVHDFMKKYFPLFTDMDFSLPTNVDLTSGSCNAYYYSSTINFFAAGSGCNSFAEMGDVVYHEYGHAISDHFYTDITGWSMVNPCLNEGCSDIWALGITHNPILAKNAFTLGGWIRRYDVIPQVYPIDLDMSSSYVDPHKNGQIIAGAWWDVAVNTGSVDTMSRLFTDVYFDVPDGPFGSEGDVYQEILIDALMADDDNSDLTDGTPHYAQIVAAFAKHGIYLEGDATLTHGDMFVQLSATPITISADLFMATTTFFHDLTLYYRINGTGSWTPVVMSGSGFTYTGTIPAQPLGTVVEYYFAIHDALNVANAYFPITCNPTLPSNYTNIPYQLGVGIHGINHTDFESAVSGWGISGNAGDNAIDGLWQITTPFPTSGWPAADHSGVGRCLMTGDGFSSTQVTQGTSTVLTPVFDITGYVTPVVEYYRWFCNEMEHRNFKDDPWVVKMRNAASTTWQTVESTYQGDDNWRRRMFRVSQYLPAGTTQMQMKFFASDSMLLTIADSGLSYTVGGLDDFTIYDQGDALSVTSAAASEIRIYPNPADDRINITLPEQKDCRLSLYDMSGKKVSEEVVPASRQLCSVSTSHLPAGSYQLVLQTDKYIQVKKITVWHK